MTKTRIWRSPNLAGLLAVYGPRAASTVRQGPEDDDDEDEGEDDIDSGTYTLARPGTSPAGP